MQQPVHVPAVNSVIPILQPLWSPESLEMAGGICDYFGHSVLATAWAEVETFVSSFLALGAAGAAVASSGCSHRPACCGCQLAGASCQVPFGVPLRTSWWCPGAARGAARSAAYVLGRNPSPLEMLMVQQELPVCLAVSTKRFAVKHLC